MRINSFGALDVGEVVGKNGSYPALLKANRDGLLRFIGVSGHHRAARFLSRRIWTW